MPQKQKEQSQRKPARATESSAHDDGAKALHAELLIEFDRATVRSAALCYERGEIARRDIALVSNHRFPFEQLPPVLQGVVVESATVLRSNLEEAFNDWRGTFRELLHLFAHSLFEINPAIAWVESELAVAHTALTGKSWYWLMIACDGKPTEHGWRAAGWIVGWPFEIPERGALLVERLDEEQSLAVLKAFGEGVARSLDLAQESALNRVKVLAAKKQGPAHSRSQRVPLDTLNSRIQESMKKNQNTSFRDICGDVDHGYESKGKSVPVPPKCKEHGHKTLLDSIDCGGGGCRDRMESLLSTNRKGLGLPRPPKSKFPPAN